MNNYIDLHAHSTCSDGTLTPTELINKAKEINLKAIALTDHDILDGIEEAQIAANNLNIEFIPGIELATYCNIGKGRREIHIVGLFIDHKNENLIEKTKIIRESRHIRNLEMIEKLNGLGFEMTYEDLLKTAKHTVFSRTHYATLMVEKGFVKSKAKAFEKYIGDGKAGYVERDLLSPEENIQAIKDAGGVAVLAHPTLYGLNYKQILSLSSDLKDMGLAGIEVMYSTYRNEQEREITKIANTLNLKHSGGSDFHGTNKEGIYLGVGKGNLRIPYSFVENFKER